MTSYLGGAVSGIAPRLRTDGPITTSDPDRDAAVLVLFGVLDRLPSDHEARTAAVSRDLDVLLLVEVVVLLVAVPGVRPVAELAARQVAEHRVGVGLDVPAPLEGVELAVEDDLGEVVRLHRAQLRLDPQVGEPLGEELHDVLGRLGVAAAEEAQLADR